VGGEPSLPVCGTKGKQGSGSWATGTQNSTLEKQKVLELESWGDRDGSHLLFPQAMKKIYKAGLKYPEWKHRHDPGYKPWVYPEQNTLPSLSLAELSLQHADSLEHIDETGLSEEHLSASDHEA